MKSLPTGGEKRRQNHETRFSASTARRGRIGSATASRSGRMLSHGSQGGHVSPFLLLDYAGPAEFEPTRRAARRRRPSAPRLRDRDHRLRRRGGAPRLDRRRRPDRPRRRAVDDGRVRHPARGVPLAGLHRAGRRRSRWCSSGSTCRPRTRWRRPATRRLLDRRHPDRCDCRTAPARCASIAGELRRRRRVRRARSRRSTSGTCGCASGKARRSTLPEGHTRRSVVLRGTVAVNGAGSRARSADRAARPRRRRRDASKPTATPSCWC